MRSTRRRLLDLRSLNEKEAGEGGQIIVKDGEFVHSKTGQPVRFWAVNGPPESAKDRPALRQLARWLAKHGINMVRVHGGYFNENGEVDAAKVQHAIADRRGDEGRGHLYALLHLLPAVADAQAGDGVAAGVRWAQAPVCGAVLQQGFPEGVRGVVEGAPHDAEREDRPAAGG